MAEIRLTEPVTISAGETKQVEVYSNTEAFGLVLGVGFLRSNDIIILEQYIGLDSYVLTIHKLLTTKSVNNYPRAVHRVLLPDEVTTIESGIVIAVTIPIGEQYD